ncbi:MAG: 3-oxoacyl-[acyl-carrier-protein] reductase [Pelagibacteraceae bacterium]|nr:3-oxoacyl-[acyl-carrier-protein] reductase [Pelagibacteraceae bacterium]|tara:strand:- start:222 stop:965 length:744 start_codon:yes stop_codon:yes gene_type:complete
MTNLILKNKTALITGASGAIGSSIAKKLSSLGANLVITGTNKKKIDDLKKKLGPNCEGLIADLSKTEDIQNLYNQSIKKFKSIDILVNNAGINKDSLSIRMSKNEWDEVININLSSAFKLSQLSIKSMIKKKWGRIIGISSIIGIGGNIGQSNYAASKAGMIALHKSLALEFASRGVTANCIAPGFIESPMTEALSDEQKEMMLKKIPVGSVGKPEDIANCVAFLTDEKASFITGSTININGGMLMV